VRATQVRGADLRLKSDGVNINVNVSAAVSTIQTLDDMDFLPAFRRPSTILSTATLLPAHASTRDPRATSCLMYSTSVVVFPVPGGP